MKRRLAAAALFAATTFFAPAVFAADEAAASPQVMLDKSPKIVAYQLRRLSNAQLLAVERKADHAKYKPVHEAILTRKGVERKFRQEALDALVKLDNSDAATELLGAVGAVPADDKATPHDLLAMLMAQKPETLKAQRAKIEPLAKEADKDLVKQAAYAALATADGRPDEAWKLAGETEGGMRFLLGGVPMIADAKLRGAFYERVAPLAAKAADAPTQVAAIEALSAMPGHEAHAFGQLAELVRKADGDMRDAAMRSLRRVVSDKWPKDQVAPLAEYVVELVRKTPAEQRTGPSAVQAVQLGNDLAGALAPEQGGPIRKTLRGLAAQVVLIRTLREQMLYDLRYFVVQAGKPVQLVLENGDAMPHNWVLTAPGAMQEVANAGAPLLPTGADNEKAHVPSTPKVLQATILVQPEETTTINFAAPDKPGEYPFVCTFPGHSVRMYGVMMVVADIDAYDAKPTPPKDPVTRQPITRPKHDGTDVPAVEHNH